MLRLLAGLLPFPVYLSVCLPACLPACLSIHQSILLSAPSACLPVCRSACQPINLSSILLPAPSACLESWSFLLPHAAILIPPHDPHRECHPCTNTGVPGFHHSKHAADRIEATTTPDQATVTTSVWFPSACMPGQDRCLQTTQPRGVCPRGGRKEGGQCDKVTVARGSLTSAILIRESTERRPPRWPCG